MMSSQDEKEMKRLHMLYQSAYQAGKSDAVVHGKWVHTLKYSEMYRKNLEYDLCSNCNKQPKGYYDLPPYCPNCGAKMESESNT